jgi:PhnB protein
MTPKGYHTVTPYLIVRGARQLIEFMKAVFEADVLHSTVNPEGKPGHTEVRIGDSVVMLSEARGEYAAMPTMLYVYVDDADFTYKKAIDAGATAVRPVTDQSYGDRSGGFKDMCGNEWWVASPIAK